MLGVCEVLKVQELWIHIWHRHQPVWSSRWSKGSCTTPVGANIVLMVQAYLKAFVQLHTAAAQC